jgi:hypothetical protein
MNERVVLIGAATLVGALAVAACQGEVDLRGIAGDGGQDGMDAGNPINGTSYEDAANYQPEDAGSSPSSEPGKWYPLDAAAYQNLDANYYQAPDAGSCVEPVPLNGGMCQASCCAPVHADQNFTSLEQYYTTVLGRWLFCDPSMGAAQLVAPSDTIGVEWDPGVIGDAGCDPQYYLPDGGYFPCFTGDFWYLVPGPTGPVRGTTPDYHLTYDLEFSNGTFDMNLHTQSGTVYTTFLEYSSCPLMFTVIGPFSNFTDLLVPLE